MDIVLNRCCGQVPLIFYTEDGNGVYAKCPACERRSGTIPLRANGYLDRNAAEACARKWNEQV